MTIYYYKKPVQIEAKEFIYTTECINDLKEWMGPELVSYGKARSMDAIGWAEIGTLEDGNPETSQVKHIATEGDYIIKGIRGEFYAIKPEIFHETYVGI